MSLYKEHTYTLRTANNKVVIKIKKQLILQINNLMQSVLHQRE